MPNQQRIRVFLGQTCCSNLSACQRLSDSSVVTCRLLVRFGLFVVALKPTREVCPLGRMIAVQMSEVIHRDPEIMSGTPVFVGTRVPVYNLFDYLEAGDSLDKFLASFPSVRRDQAIAALELAKEAVTELASSNRRVVAG